MKEILRKHWSTRSIVQMISFLLLFLSPLLFTLNAWASSRLDENISDDTLQQEETIDGPGFFTGNLVRIDGTINGTAFISGQDIEISGTINGDLFIAGQNVAITGKVAGNIYGAAMTIRMEGEAGQDAFMTGQTVAIKNRAVLKRDLFLAGATLLQEGEVQRHLFGMGQTVEIAGTVAGDANLSVSNLVLRDQARIEGNLSYESEKEANIASNAVGGETYFKRVRLDRENQQKRSSWNKISARMWSLLWSLLSALLVWFLVKLWRPTWWERTAQPLQERPWAALGFGFLAFLLTPLLVILLFVTIVGIPLGLLLITGYAALLYLAKIFVAIAAAVAVDKRTHWTDRHKGGWLVILALLVLGLLGVVPILNMIAGILVIVSGLGTFLLSHYRTHKPPENSLI